MASTKAPLAVGVALLAVAFAHPLWAQEYGTVEEVLHGPVL